MNARSYRIHVNLSPLNFPAIDGLGETEVAYVSDVTIINNKVLLMIAKSFVLRDVYNNKLHSVLTAQSIYEIPPNEIKSIEDVYEFYKDATLTLNEAYQYARTQEPLLPERSFPNQSIKEYEREIDRVFNFLDSRN